MIDKFLEKYSITKIVFGVTVFKIFLLPFQSHPFDFVTYWYRYAQYYLFDISVFRNFNKGLISIFWEMPSYSLYAVLFETFNLELNQILILNTIFKVPYLLFDIIILLIVLKINNSIKYKSMSEKDITLLWIMSPVPFLNYGVHLGIEIAVVLGISLLILGTLKNSWILMSLGAATAIQIKFFPIIYIPFIFLYLLKQKKLLDLGLKFSLLSLLILFFSFLHFTDPTNLDYLVNSLINHSGTAQEVVKSQQVSTNNIFGYLNYFIKFDSIDLTRDETLFIFIRKYSILFVPFIISLIIIIRYLKKDEYCIKELFFDLYLSTLILFLFLNNFQRHYLIYPFFLIFLMSLFDKRLSKVIGLLSIFIAFITLKGEEGSITFIQSLIKPLFIPGFNNYTGFIIDFLNVILVSSLILILFYDKIKDTKIDFLKYYLLSWILITIPIIFYFVTYFSNPSKLKNEYLYKGLSYGNLDFEIPISINRDDIRTESIPYSNIYINEILKNEKFNASKIISLELNINKCYSETYIKYNDCVYKINYKTILKDNKVILNNKCFDGLIPSLNVSPSKNIDILSYSTFNVNTEIKKEYIPVQKYNAALLFGIFWFIFVGSILFFIFKEIKYYKYEK